MSEFPKKEFALFGLGAFLLWVLGAIVSLGLLAGAVYVVVWVLQSMGVLAGA